ncbi:dynamin family protein [Granulicoccus sp. GXG6511]|uniref:dynamin family protein n=1 Tax=Granulicoccus sp. GXG6511 TaxID=3381351 RepID=UPI003D7C8D68
MSLLDADPSDPLPLARELFTVADRATAGLPELAAQVGFSRERLEGPLRVAMAGKVKAGKSTLVNAFLGDELAPTDAGECTMVTTWFQFGRVPATRVVAKDGSVTELPFRRRGGQFVMGLGGLSPAEVSRVEVDWPSPFLERLTLIDTPGIDSLTTEASDRTTDLLLESAGAAAVDAVIYLMRHRHSVDLTFVSDLARGAADAHGAATTLVVLSRADELGGGRIDSLVSARDVARSYADEPMLRAHSVGVIPVAGLLAQGARMLRQDDFDLLAALTTVSRDEREAMLISADRYAQHGLGGTPDQRQALVRRLGLFGIRMGTALIRQGSTTPADLAAELESQSGLGAVEAVLTEHFLPRARVLIARNAVTLLEQVAEECSEPGRRDLLAACDRFRVEVGQPLAELSFVVQARRAAVQGLAPEDALVAARVLGDEGPTVRHRLGLKPDDGINEASAQLVALTQHWGAVAAAPGTWRPARRVAIAVVGALDRMAVMLADVDRSATT